MAKLRGEQTTSKYTIKQAEKTIIDKGGKSLLAKIKKEATNLNNEPEKWKKIEKELISLGKAYGQNFIYNSEQSNRAWKKVSAQKITGTAKDPCPVPSWLSDKEKEIFNEISFLESYLWRSVLIIEIAGSFLFFWWYRWKRFDPEFARGMRISAITPPPSGCGVLLSLNTPDETAGKGPPPTADLRNFRWPSHCQGLFQTPIAD
jgi:hypothetical protein